MTAATVALLRCLFAGWPGAQQPAHSRTIRGSSAIGAGECVHPANRLRRTRALATRDSSAYGEGGDRIARRAGHRGSSCRRRRARQSISRGRSLWLLALAWGGRAARRRPARPRCVLAQASSRRCPVPGLSASVVRFLAPFGGRGPPAVRPFRLAAPTSLFVWSRWSAVAPDAGAGASPRAGRGRGVCESDRVGARGAWRSRSRRCSGSRGPGDGRCAVACAPVTQRVHGTLARVSRHAGVRWA
jgi:hypothetical protein